MYLNRLFNILCTFLTVATQATETKSSNVVELVQANLTDFISRNNLILVEFYDPQCQYCQALAPEYEAAASTLKQKNIPLAKVDCTTEKDLCRDYNAKGYPDLQVLRGLQDTTPYTGSRRADSIVSFMVRQSMPVVSNLAKEGLAAFQSSDDNVLIAHIASDDVVSREAFLEAAAELRHRFLCGIVNGIHAADMNEPPLPYLVLHKNHDKKERSIFTEPLESQSIKSFARNAILPLVGDINSDTFAIYQESGLPLVWAFGETLEERSQLADILLPIARTHKRELHFGVIDAVEYGDSAVDLNLRPGKFPALVILNLETNRKFTFDQDQKITTESVADFVQSFLSGNLEPSIASQPVPKEQDGPVTVVVGHSFHKVVFDDDKDVLVQIYAPWCGHSKRLAPTYDVLGSAYATSKFSHQVTIAKIDGSKNDVPEGIPKGYPMLMLYPAGSKDVPITYNGDRSLKDLITFISENGRHGAFIPVKENIVKEAVTPTGKEMENRHNEL